MITNIHFDSNGKKLQEVIEQFLLDYYEKCISS